MPDFRELPEQVPNNNTDVRTAHYDRYQQLARWLWRGFYAVAGLFVVSCLIISFTTPSFKQLEDPSLNLASEVIAGDDITVLGRLYIENRSPVSYDQIPKYLVQALVSTEDERFYEHSGVDARALLRVFKSAFFLKHGQGGGSTISMQLAKLLYSDRDFKNMNVIEKALGYYYRKLSEMVTAIKLERAYTKEEIVAMYLNKYDFGYNAYGIRAASEIYFAKSPDQLSLEESATLIGMCNNSSLFNPVKRNERTKNRRNLVLERMERNGYLAASKSATYQKLPLDVSKFKTRSHNDGLATYFRTSLADELKSLIKKNNITKSDGTLYDVYRDGLKIYTTIDAEMQKLAEDAMHEHMAQLQIKFFKVWQGKDPWRYGDKDQISSRLAALDASIRISDRYAIMRSRFLDDVCEKIEKRFTKYTLQDNDIKYMIRAETQPAVLDDLDDGRAAILQQIMSSEAYAPLKDRWKNLQKEVIKVFNQPVKMRVFAHNAIGEKDTVMSPLDSVRYHRMQMQLGAMGMDPTSGFVRFWVGGIGHKYFQVDHVRVDRQVGSTFKPFVYSAAIAQFGVSPCMTIQDVPQTISRGEGSFGLSFDWTPKNSHGFSGDYMTLWDALKESKNTASVRLVKDMQSVQPIRDIVREMGIDADAKYANGQLRIPKSPAICLGAADLTVYEMTGAYSTFANSGVYHKPIYLRRVTDKHGKLLYQSLFETHQALPENAAYVMQQMLKYNVKQAPGISNLKSDVGGKTGTTNDFKDGWFMGITPKLVIGTWVGGEDTWIHFLSLDQGQGAVMARPFYSKFMEKLEKSNSPSYNPAERFKEMTGNIGIVLDCSQYKDNNATVDPNAGHNEFDPNRFQDEEQTATKPQTAAPAMPGQNNTAPKPGLPKPKATLPAPKKKSNNPDDGFGG